MFSNVVNGFGLNFIKNEFSRIYYAKILATDTDKPFSYLQSNFFVEHLPDKCFYKELVKSWEAPQKCSLKLIVPKFLKYEKDSF